MKHAFIAVGALLSLAACTVQPTEPDGGAAGTIPEGTDQYVADGCVVGGCSSHVCSDAGGEPIVTTCEWTDAYACYRTARCEKQADGQCGWTMTSELSSCLMDPPTT